MYRIVQECRCGCGKKRAFKTEKRELAPKFHHAEITGQAALTVSPEELTLEALAEPAVKRAMGGVVLEEVAPMRLAIWELEGRIRALERELGLTMFQRLKRALGFKL